MNDRYTGRHIGGTYIPAPDREIIARTLHRFDMTDEGVCDEDNLERAWAVLHESYKREADAVLAAIGERLLPELPTVIGDYRIVDTYQITPNNDDTWSVLILDDSDDLITDGTGANVPEAIRNALEAYQ